MLKSNITVRIVQLPVVQLGLLVQELQDLRNNGPKILPCGIPLSTSNQAEKSLLQRKS